MSGAAARAAPAPSARAAVLLSFASRYATLALRAASLLALSRLLGPEEFGVSATAGAVVALVFVFAEFGLHSHLVQAPRLSRAAVGAAVGLSCALAAAAFSAVALGALFAPAAWLGDEARTLLLLLAASAAVQPIALPVTAKLHRRMLFGRLLAVDIARTAAAVGTSITLAAQGFGALSIGWGAIADAAVGTGLALLLGAGRRPVWPRFAGWSPALRFGGPFALTGGMRQAGDAGTALLIGAAFGTAAVGLYNRALTVTDMLDKAIVQGLSPVVLPVLSREVRRGGALGPLYLRKLGYLSVIHWPFFTVLLLLAEPAVLLVLGPQWGAAVPLVQALAVAGLFGPFTAISMKFFVALGANGPYARLQFAAMLAKLGAVAALSLVSLPAAVFGLAAGAAVRAALITLSLERRLGVGARAVGARLAPGTLVTALAVLGPAAVHSWSGGRVDLPGAALAGGLALLGWAAGLLATRHEFGAELARLGAGALRRLPSPLPFAYSRPWRR